MVSGTTLTVIVPGGIPPSIVAAVVAVVVRLVAVMIMRVGIVIRADTETACAVDGVRATPPQPIGVPAPS
jgi:hypothetical protein